MSATEGLDAKLRKAAREKLGKDAEEARKNFLLALGNLQHAHTGSITVDVSKITRITHPGNPQFDQRPLVAKASMSDLLLYALSAWVAEVSPRVEEKAVAEFIERVDRLASEVDEIREYAQDAQR